MLTCPTWHQHNEAHLLLIQTIRAHPPNQKNPNSPQEWICEKTSMINVVNLMVNIPFQAHDMGFKFNSLDSQRNGPIMKISNWWHGNYPQCLLTCDCFSMSQGTCHHFVSDQLSTLCFPLNTKDKANDDLK